MTIVICIITIIIIIIIIKVYLIILSVAIFNSHKGLWIMRILRFPISIHNLHCGFRGNWLFTDSELPTIGLGDIQSLPVSCSNSPPKYIECVR